MPVWDMKTNPLGNRVSFDTLLLVPESRRQPGICGHSLSRHNEYLAAGSGSTPLFFRQLSCGFDIRDGMLRISGHADSVRPNVLVATSAGSLLEVPPQHQTPQQDSPRSFATIRTAPGTLLAAIRPHG